MKRTQTEAPLATSVEHAGRLLGIGRNSAYKAVRDGDIPSVRIGGRILVPMARLRALLDGEHQRGDV